ncbi:SDR family oxidoreductase [Saccharothrix violaceirubra]|uniref:NAD(P)-dependent dehydrogenase (Short-subunit alcohol dehydrogenase family) n=1 Tax=Saccharothrix violaceirubra TaxID=413306 RepID=A0A7W7T0D1_9PSEU|nr:SDR family oxidoreductase [Saccharothrix violaceirubra]MBB4964254.1 NAD(P)-dependent dehydrogenase (short-subunit alcohol dehydrogenase family) [Saccharothrix violaceirubra]
MDIGGSTALVTGANRGLGRVLAAELLARGAKTVYAAAREPDTVTVPGVVPVRLDVTDPGQVAAAAERCGDVTLLVNNAGVLTNSPLLGVSGTEPAAREMAVNYFGMLAMCQAFAAPLGRNGGGAIVNILSVASFYTNPATGSYSASKAAAWALTNGVRVELRRQGTLVVGVHCGYIDTDMAAGVTAAKASPEHIAALTLDAVRDGYEEVLADEKARAIKASIPRHLEELYPEVQRAWDSRVTPASG